MSNGKAQTATPKFEDAIEQLESIIEKVESGQIGLEESLLQYERGMKLIKQCRQILDAAEQRIEELGVDSTGRVKIEEADDQDPIQDPPGSPGGDEPSAEEDDQSFE